MSPDTATQTATEPDDFYDSLPKKGQRVWDKIGALGYKPERTEDGAFIATRLSDPTETVGPCEFLGTLLADVRDRMDISPNDDPDELPEEFYADPQGKVVNLRQPLLPNTEDAVLEDLRAAILSYRATTMEILDLQKRQKEEQKLAKALMHKFEDELSKDPETGFLFFQVEMVIAELEIETKEKLVTRTAAT